MESSALRVFIAIVLGIMCIGAAIVGRPGSMIGALLDTNDMEKIES